MGHFHLIIAEPCIHSWCQVPVEASRAGLPNTRLICHLDQAQTKNVSMTSKALNEEYFISKRMYIGGCLGAKLATSKLLPWCLKSLPISPGKFSSGASFLLISTVLCLRPSSSSCNEKSVLSTISNRGSSENLALEICWAISESHNSFFIQLTISAQTF